MSKSLSSRSLAYEGSPFLLLVKYHQFLPVWLLLSLAYAMRAVQSDSVNHVSA